ncbi:MAG: DUF4916 domain-containing protein [Microbacterium sp.]|uniref:DUF4916 domain-containing protein n=2 Tax=Microbacterium ginsengisoli TaxID=400772 RepID=A0A0F0M2K4_9MICO|nr:hypothetical protein RR49_00489 [Microbacterium ginsengisoli]MAL07781.1 DUF4916 domain-containing protein [Microbacterium sp.]HAN24115.1 DUF4916 domain-containing protein [Microbacterium ginsengisoli]
MTFLPDGLYAQIEANMPIACVDFVPVERAEGRISRVGLILRESPHGRVWCHLGGRVRRGETLRAALERHSLETIGLELDVSVNPQPDAVFEWFPSSIAPADGTVFGDDPRKHAIGLAYVLGMPFEGASPRGEALDFASFDPTNLPADLWPGCRELFTRLGITERAGN